MLKSETSMKAPEKPKETVPGSKKIVHFEEPAMSQALVPDKNLCVVCSAPPYGRMKKCVTCSLPVHARCAGPVSNFLCASCSEFC